MATGSKTPSYVAFAGTNKLAAGSLAEVAVAARRAQDQVANVSVLVFDRHTAEVIDLDLRGTERDVAARYAPDEAAAPKRGRPKLGVVAREVTLLPRHWDWLVRQPGGASTTLRRLVDTAQKSGAGAARARTDTCYRFMSAIAGDLPGFEEATRALFAGDLDRLNSLMSAWPPHLREEIASFATAQPPTS